MKSQKSLFFRSVDKTMTFNKSVEGSADYEKEVTSDILITREDGIKFTGTTSVQLKYDHTSQVWGGNCKIQIEGETVTFVCTRKSSVNFIKSQFYS